MDIQWYPGHMAKTRKMLIENLKIMDAVVEIVDARAPIATANNDLKKLYSNKPKILVLNKADLADPETTAAWVKYYREMGQTAIAVTSIKSKGIKEVIDAVTEAAKDKVEAMAKKGVRKTVRAMVLGIPNVGKSTFINKLKGKASAKAGDRPGVTRGKQWIAINDYLEFLDTPGMLWPKQNDKKAAMRLAYIGSINDNIINMEELACNFLMDMYEMKPEAIKERFHIDELIPDGWELLQKACKGRGWILSGGRLDTERGAKVIMDEFRAGKLGTVSLERP
ncbi:MAG: ribosome biogenesis GTPase YlqF [Clostridiales bacterium]|nr:ribosome biogenesis GTPase YlqF [Clostridiales bacterium]